MGAPARSVPVLPSRRPTRRPMPRRRPDARPHNGLKLIGKTAHAVTHLPETGVVRSAATGYRWIFVVVALLLVIVGINVFTVSYGAVAGKLETQIQEIERQNTILRSSQTSALATPRVQAQAEAAGMFLPASDGIEYRSYQQGDFAAAAQRLAAGG